MAHSDFTLGVELHQELNPKLWRKDQLDSRVKDALLRIARDFYQYLDVDIAVRDITVTGSQASYLYTDHSDLDLHIIVDYEHVDCEEPVEQLFDARRKLWKQEHDIKIHGIPVEVYAEDSARPVRGSVYSLLKDRWIVEPERPDQDLPENVERLAQAWTIMILAAVRSRDPRRLKKIKGLLMTYRQQSLAQSGELSRGNLVFKTLRNSGVIGTLMKSLHRLEDLELSLPD